MKRGYEIVLDANISGSPYPEITWYWNNQVIRPEPLRKRPERPLKKKVEKKKEEEKKEEGEVKKEEEKKEVEKKEEPAAEAEEEESEFPTINERLTINNSRRGTSSVVIKDSVRPDHGVYMVKVENDHGISSATCEVNILGEKCY